MTIEELRSTVASMNQDQLRAFRVCLMAERRLRDLYPRSITPMTPPAMEEAYLWALNQEGKFECPVLESSLKP